MTWLTLLQDLNYTVPKLLKCLAIECYQQIFVHKLSAQTFQFLTQPDVRSDKLIMPILQVMAMDVLRDEYVSKMLAKPLKLISLCGAMCIQQSFGCIRHRRLQISLKIRRSQRKEYAQMLYF